MPCEMRRRTRRPTLVNSGSAMSERIARVLSHAGRVLAAPEENQERVTSELQHIAAVPLDDLDHAGEAVREERGQLLTPFAPEGRELLGERGEAREISRDERAVDREMRSGGPRARSSRGT